MTTTREKMVADAISSYLGSVPTGSLIAAITNIVESELSSAAGEVLVLTDHNRRLLAEVERLKESLDLVTANRDGLLGTMQKQLDRLAAAEAERDRAWGVVHGTQSKTLVEDNQQLAAEVEQLKKAHYELASISNERLRALEHLRDLHQAELAKSNYWRKRHAEARGQQVQELWAKWKDAEAELARIRVAIEAVPLEELQSVFTATWLKKGNNRNHGLLAVRDRLLAEFDKPAEQPRPEINAQTIGGADTKLAEQPKPEEKTWGKEGVEIARAVLSDAAQQGENDSDEIRVGDTVECVDDSNQYLLKVGRRYTVSHVGRLSDGEPGIDVDYEKKPEWLTRRFRKVQPVSEPKYDPVGTHVITAARLAELEACEADAKR